MIKRPRQGLRSLILRTLCKECGACVNQVSGILDAGCLVGRVHSQLCKADIHGRHSHFRVGNVAKRRSSGIITPVREGLRRDMILFAEISEVSGGECIGSITLAGAELDDDTSVDDGAVHRISVFRMIRMDSMRIVGRNHEASGNGGHRLIIGKAQRRSKAHQDIVKECRTGALSCLASHFFIIKEGIDGNGFFLPFRG